MRPRPLSQTEEEIFNKIVSLQALVASVKPTPEACIRLSKELQKLEVYADDLARNVDMLNEIINRRESVK